MCLQQFADIVEVKYHQNVWGSHMVFSVSLIYLKLLRFIGTIKQAEKQSLLTFFSLLLFMYQIQHKPKLSAFFLALHAEDKHSYNARSATHNLLDIPLTKTNTYGKNITNHCIRDWSNLKKDLFRYSRFWTFSLKDNKLKILWSVLSFIIIIFQPPSPLLY